MKRRLKLLSGVALVVLPAAIMIGVMGSQNGQNGFIVFLSVLTFGVMALVSIAIGIFLLLE